LKLSKSCNSSLGIRGAPLAGKLKQSTAKQRGSRIDQNLADSDLIFSRFDYRIGHFPQLACGKRKPLKLKSLSEFDL
jgi:hypothetical protein